LCCSFDHRCRRLYQTHQEAKRFFSLEISNNRTIDAMDAEKVSVAAPGLLDKENKSPQMDTNTTAKVLCPLNGRKGRTASSSLKDETESGIPEANATGLQPPGWANKTKGSMSVGKAKGTSKIRSNSFAGMPEMISGPSAESVIDGLGLSEEERQEFLRDTLKRTKPPARLTGATKTYMDTETKRLATGIKELAQKTGDLVGVFRSTEATWRKNDEAVRAAAAKLGTANKVHQSSLAQHKAKVVLLEKENAKLKEENQKTEKQVSQMD
jgi:hypothetical protein